jgi:hypothetical protein
VCRSIKVLRRPGEPATAEELAAAALQFVRKISGFRKPSKANQEAFDRAVREISDSSDRLLKSMGIGPHPAHLDCAQERTRNSDFR